MSAPPQIYRLQHKIPKRMANKLFSFRFSPFNVHALFFAMTDISTPVTINRDTQNTPASPNLSNSRRRQSWLRGNSLLSLLPDFSNSKKKRRSQSLGNVRASFDGPNHMNYVASHFDPTTEQIPGSIGGGRRRSSDRSTKSSISSLFAKVTGKKHSRNNSINSSITPATTLVSDQKPYIPYVSAFDDHVIGHRCSQKRNSTSSSATAVGDCQATKTSPLSLSPRIAYTEALQPDKKLDLDELRNDAYPIENDEVEVDRLQAKNDLVKLAFDG
jgi:hypothetical protein